MTHSGGVGEVPSVYGTDDQGHGVVGIAVVAALGGFLFGYDSAVINGAVDAIRDRFDDRRRCHRSVGVARAARRRARRRRSPGGIADRLGRIRVMQIAAVLFVISAHRLGLSPSRRAGRPSRVIGGVGSRYRVGDRTGLHRRGRAGRASAAGSPRCSSWRSCSASPSPSWSTTCCIGSPVAASSDLRLGVEAWQWMLGAWSSRPSLYGVLSFTIPESPRYLSRGSEAACPQGHRRASRAARHGDLDAPDRGDPARPCGAEHKPSVRGPARTTAGAAADRLGRHRAVGVPAVRRHQRDLLLLHARCGRRSASPRTTRSHLHHHLRVVNIVGTFVAIALVDRIGRKPLLLIGSVGMAVSLAAAGGLLRHRSRRRRRRTRRPSGAAGPIALIAANAVRVLLRLSWGPVVWVLLGELFPNRIRAAALSVAAAAQWLANWAITVSFPALADFSLGVAYGLYAAFAAAVLPLRHEVGEGDQGHGARGHAGRGAAGLTSTPSSRAGLSGRAVRFGSGRGLSRCREPVSPTMIPPARPAGPGPAARPSRCRRPSPLLPGNRRCFPG